MHRRFGSRNRPLRIGSNLTALALVVGLLTPGSASGGAADEVLRLEFQEASGASAADSSGSGNDAELLNGATFDGPTLALDGLDDAAAVQNSPSLSFTNAITISGWAYPSPPLNGWRLVASRQLATANSDQFFLGFHDGRPRMGVNTTTGPRFVQGPEVSPGEWVHLAGTYNGNALRLFINGIRVNSTPKTGGILPSSRPVIIGGNTNVEDPTDATENLGGRVDDVRIFADGLSNSDIAALVGSPPPNPTFIPPPPIHVLSLGFDDPSSTAAADSSGNGNDAELLNGAATNLSALSLDGINDFGIVDDSTSLRFRNGITVAAWVNQSSQQAGWRQILTRQLGEDVADQFVLGLFDGKPRFVVNTTTSGHRRVEAPDSVPIGEWVHLAGVYNRDRLRFYVNGTRVRSIPEAGRIKSSSRPLLLGAASNASNPMAPNEFFQGEIDDVQVYTTALNAPEISALVGEGKDSQRAPVLQPIGPKRAVVDKTLEFFVSASDADGGDTVTLSAAPLPSGATFDADSGVFSWSPSAAQVGAHDVTFQALDEWGLSDSEQVTITVSQVPTRSTATVLRVVKDSGQIKGKGKVAPAHTSLTGLEVKVRYEKRKKDGAWVKKQGELVTVNAMSKFKAVFDKPNHGVYRMIAKFRGSDMFEKSKATKWFWIKKA